MLQTLLLQTRVNGSLKQNATTADMIFGVAEIVSFFSMGITLHPGDIIFTGTYVSLSYLSSRDMLRGR